VATEKSECAEKSRVLRYPLSDFRRSLTLAHQTDEYCPVDKIEEAAKVYEAIARRWSQI